MKNILVTGGAGFIGSNFLNYFVKKYPKYNIINLDSLTYAGNLTNLDSICNLKNYHFIKGDICDFKLVERIFRDYKINCVIHFAAESHVDNSINNPNNFIQTNINGTHNLLFCAYKSWFSAPNKPKIKHHIFFHISTDEVYGSIKKGKFSENSPYAPNSPYSASKASSDMLTRSFHKTYGMNIFITNCSNNFGPNQHDEKLIPTIIKNALNNESIPIYGDGKNVRDWLFVDSHIKAIDKIFHSTFFGENFNIGANCQKSNISIAKMICSILDKKLPKKTSYKNQIKFVADRAGHDRRYAIDSSKFERFFNTKIKSNFKKNLESTINHYIARYGGGGANLTLNFIIFILRSFFISTKNPTHFLLNPTTKAIYEYQ